ENGGTITLSSESDNIQILQGTYSFGAVGIADSLYLDNAFQIKIVGTYADHSLAPLTFVCSYDDFETESFHWLQLAAPILDISNYIVNSAGPFVMPGDTVDISFNVQNSGSGTAFSPMMILFSGDSTVNTSVYDLSLPAAIPGEILEVSNAFSVSISEAAELGTNVSVSYMLSAENGPVAEGSFLIHIGMMNYDFESGLQDWHSVQLNQSYINQWHRSSAKNATDGGSYSMKFGGSGSGQYSSSSYGALISPQMSLGTNSTLKFQHWMDAENHDSYPAYAWDGGNVQISVDGGAWVLIEPVGSYPHQIYNNPASPFATGTPVYSGSFGWAEAEFDLSSYSGQVKFRFVFGSDAYVTGDGWYVDNIRLESEPTSTTDPISVPVVLSMDQNFPNPFNPKLISAFHCPRLNRLSLTFTTSRVNW
ncbi:MAG: immune inhibitor A, partial [Candidatus Cloacimonetes bacterium]|nr:immune inhibitor A [Candidatus Cloacimonadota bacterium]